MILRSIPFSLRPRVIWSLKYEFYVQWIWNDVLWKSTCIIPPWILLRMKHCMREGQCNTLWLYYSNLWSGSVRVLRVSLPTVMEILSESPDVQSLQRFVCSAAQNSSLFRGSRLHWCTCYCTSPSGAPELMRSVLSGGACARKRATYTEIQQWHLGHFDHLWAEETSMGRDGKNKIFFIFFKFNLFIKHI